MGLSESGYGCKKHPNHQEKQGVCPSCLRERLSRLCSVPNKEANSRVAPSCSPSLSLSPDDYSSASSSSKSASAARHRNFHKRNGSGAMGIMGSSSFVVKVGTSKGLNKSRSIAFVPRNIDDEEAKKKKGFWSKLLRFKGKRDVLTHSTSMRFIMGRVN